MKVFVVVMIHEQHGMWKRNTSQGYPELQSEFEASLQYDHLLRLYLQIRINSKQTKVMQMNLSLGFFLVIHMVFTFLEFQYWGRGCHRSSELSSYAIVIASFDKEHLRGEIS